MKYRIYSFFYITIMFCYLIRPVLPYIEYAVNKDYIATHLCVSRMVPGNCCQGKCYLNQLLQKNAENNESDRNDNKIKIQNNKIDDHLMVNVVFTRRGESTINLLADNRFSIVLSYVPQVFIPPQN